MLQSKTRWLLPENTRTEEEILTKELQLPPVMARLLVQRGITGAEQARRFLNPSAEQLGSPYAIEGMQEILQKVKAAIEQQIPISMISSDDIDSIFGTSLLIHTIRQCNGLISDSMTVIGEEFPQELLSSWQNKTSVILCFGLNALTMQLMASLGLDCVFIHPALLKSQNGDGTVSMISLHLAQGLRGEIPFAVLDLAAIGIIAANVPLLGENRTAVKLGLDSLSRTRIPGLQWVKQICHLSHSISTEQIQSLVLPRLEQSESALSLLAALDEEEASHIGSLMEEEFVKRSPAAADSDRFPERYTLVDAIVDIEEMDIKTIEQLNQLAPFGNGNDSPLFFIQQAELRELRTSGVDHRHFKCVCTQGDHAVEATARDLGNLAPFISKQAKADLIGEFVIHEWNGVRKPHFWIRDLSIRHTQIFDLRGTREKAKKLNQLADDRSLAICFRKESLEELEGLPHFMIDADGMQAGEWAWTSEEQVSNLFLYDMPHSLSQLQEWMDRIPHPERIYCLFGAEHNNQLGSIPAREQFKWLYGFLLKRRTLMKKHIPELSKAKGISVHAIQFMLDVFEDLGFTKLAGEGDIAIKESPERKELTESAIYQRKRQELELETEILYSSFDVLCRTLKKDTITYS